VNSIALLSGLFAACYAFPHTIEDQAMPTNDLIPSLIYKLNENQLAIAAAVEDLSIWIEQLHGPAEDGTRIRNSLTKLDENLEFITRGVASLLNDR
jgi:hypothetical protein